MAAALTTAQIVQKMYISFYGRGADVDGLAYWVARLGDDTDTTAIRESFSTSTEAVALFGGKTDTATVTAIYLQTFGRNPDDSGLKFYKDALTANTMTKAEIAANILDGATGDDASIVANKLAVAELFTAALDTAAKKEAYVGNVAANAVRENFATVGVQTVPALFDVATTITSMVSAAVAAVAAFEAAAVVHAAAITVYDAAIVVAAASKVAAATAATTVTTIALSTASQTAAVAAVNDATAVTTAATAVTVAAAALTAASAATPSSTLDDTTAATAVSAASAAAAAAVAAEAEASGSKTTADAALVAATAADAAAILTFDAAEVIHAAAIVTYDAAVVTAAASVTAAATAAGNVISVTNATASVTAAATAVSNAAAVTAAASAITTAAAALTTTSAATTQNTVDNVTAATAVAAAATTATAAATAATAAATVKTTADAALVTALATAKTFSMTTGADTFAGGIGDDTFTANILTLGTSDTATDATTTDNDIINITSNTGITEVQTVTITYVSGSSTDVVTINGHAVSFVTGANQDASTAALTAAVDAHSSLANRVDAVDTGGGVVTLNWLIDGNQVDSVDTTSSNNTNTVATVTEGNASVERGTTLTNIENLNLKSLGDTTVDMTNITGVKSFATTNSTGAIVVDNASSATMALGFSGQFNNTMTVNYASGLTGSDDNILMNVTSAKNVAVDVDTGFERATLTLNGTANTVTSITTPKSGGMSLTISGSSEATFAANAFVSSSAYTIINPAALKFGAIDTLDVKTFTATANTGGITGSSALVSPNIYSTDEIDGATTGLTMFLGSGNDNVLINETAISTKTNTIMLGGGNDVIDLDNGGLGAIYLFGEAGDDNIRVKTTALETTDTISGGDGTDTLTLTGDLVHNLVLVGVENINLDATVGAKTTVSSSDRAVVFTTSAIANDSVDLAGLVTGSSVVVNANSSTTAAAAEVDAIDVAFTAAEGTSTIDVNTAQDGNIVTTNITALTLDFAEIVGSTAQSDINVTAGTSLTINAVKDITFDDILAGSDLLTSVTVVASDKVTIDDVLNEAVLATVSITATDDISLGKITDADKLTSITLTSAAGSVVVDEIGDNAGVSTDSDNLATVLLSGGTTVTAGIIEADIIGNVTMTATSGLLTVTEITSAAAMGAVALTATAGGVKIDTGDIVAADTTGITANITASTFINVTGASGGAKADVTNSKGDIASTLSGDAAATIDYSAGTVNTAARSGSVALIASNTGGIVTTVTNNELVGGGASVVTLSASSSSIVNSVTLLGYSSTTNVTGSIGADTIVNSDGGDILATDSTNSNDTYSLGNGTDTLSYAGNTHGAASGTSSAGATTNGYAMNFSSSSISFDNNAVSSATNITTLAAGKVAQYDSTAVSSASATAGNIVAGGETDTVSGVETAIGSGLNDYIAAASAGMTITGGLGADKIIGGAGTDTIIIGAGDSDFGTISSPLVAVSVLADIITLAAGDILDLTGALATQADYDTLTEVAAGGTITTNLTTNEVGQFVGVYDPATGNFTSSSTMASGTGSSTDVDALLYTYAVADGTDTTATEGLIIIGLGAQVDSAILNGVITFA